MYLTRLICKDGIHLYVFSKTPPEDLVFSIKEEVRTRTSRNVTLWLTIRNITVKRSKNVLVKFKPSKKGKQKMLGDFCINNANFEINFNG